MSQKEMENWQAEAKESQQQLLNLVARNNFEWRCETCRKIVNPFSAILQKGHMITVKNGGNAKLKNLHLQCIDCNTIQGTTNFNSRGLKLLTNGKGFVKRNQENLKAEINAIRIGALASH